MRPAKLSELLKLVKQSLSIVETATAKDEELSNLIYSAVQDIYSLGVEVEKIKNNPLLNTTIVLYVKAHFGNVNIKEKELALKMYKENVGTLAYRTNLNNRRIPLG